MDASKGFPRTYLINTSKEALRDDAQVMETALKDAGVQVKRDVLPGLIIFGVLGWSMLVDDSELLLLKVLSGC